eukprot:CAMPEP_0194046512 /NCGR_PEP_ID=MMETSP0009_2-20130614/21388_1 /TAXON_ID=210454 /ORGANISM="Grammatophora oceanica, Strain CCMP 410" /LENGTH=189 /DNA_ID=CAMNT_0038691831 /DNA_START=31 /DNA_END=600 /DNA_ORIENTATION=+
MGAIKDYDVDEVCIFLSCIGLGTKVEPFRENAVDGDMFTTLSHEDLTGDLGLSNLQAKKVLRAVQEEGDGGGGEGDLEETTARIQALEAENAQLKSQIAALKRQLQPPAPAPAPKPAPAPAPAPPPPQPRQPGVIGGAARGAAGGAMKGAIAGAILPGMSASDGAKAGAAVGATTGGLRGLRGRRGRRF